MPELIALSQSSLQDYNDCARRFELRYLQQFAYPAIESEPALENELHQKEGEYFHRLVQQHLIGLPAEQVGRLAISENLQRWWGNFLPFSQTGLSTLSHRQAELTLSAPLGKYRLLAKYDLVGRAEDGKVYIYDWKTYRRRPKNDWLAARWQTRVYRALLVKAGMHLNQGRPFEPEQIEMIYWFADFPAESARFAYNAAQFKRDWDALVRLADEITTVSTFPKTDDVGKCSYCPYRSYCDRGIKAGDRLDTELETAAEESFEINFEQIGEIEF